MRGRPRLCEGYGRGVRSLFFPSHERMAPPPIHAQACTPYTAREARGNPIGVGSFHQLPSGRVMYTPITHTHTHTQPQPTIFGFFVGSEESGMPL
jgi:hypothetical protein